MFASAILISALATLISAAPTNITAFSATQDVTSTAHVINSCLFPIFLKSVDGNHPDSQRAIRVESGATWSEHYKQPWDARTNDIAGVSIKISRDEWNFRDSPAEAGVITQFEYTFKNDGKIWYDGSNVNCRGRNCPFYDYGVRIFANRDAHPDWCMQPHCTPGECNPNHFYKNFNDDVSTKSCDANANIYFNACNDRK
jgi:hypothetical protein